MLKALMSMGDVIARGAHLAPRMAYGRLGSPLGLLSDSVVSSLPRGSE